MRDIKRAVTSRILRLMNRYIKEGRVLNASTFLTSIGVSRQNLRKLKNGELSFTIDQVHLFCRKYKEDANRILGLKKPPDRNPAATKRSMKQLPKE